MDYYTNEYTEGNRYISTEVERLAQERGWGGEVQLFRDPDFNYFQFAERALAKSGFAGADLQEATHNVVWNKIYDIKNGGPGVLLRNYDGRIPFDDFFKLAISRDSKTKGRDLQTRRKRTPFAIVPGGDDDWSGAISESTLPGGLGADEEEERQQKLQELHEQRENALQQWDAPIKDLVLQKRNGDKMWRIWKLYQEGNSFDAIARIFNDEGYPTVRGGPWQRGTVNGLYLNVRDLLHEVLDKRGEGHLLTELEKKRFNPGEKKHKSASSSFYQKRYIG